MNKRRPVNLDGPPTDDADAVADLLTIGTATQLVDFVLAGRSAQVEFVRKAIGPASVRMFEALLDHNEPALTALQKTILLSPKESPATTAGEGPTDGTAE